ncbi:MAG TPA: alpha/beta hydrolase [Tepidisphaeraceae bacterium]|jgi:pimeloyl-ACP methyl ester carboxylesterase
MPTKLINNTNLHYVDRGHGTPVLLVHGFPLDSRMWDAQIEALSDHYRIIAPDLRGFGQSASTNPFTMDSLADDLHALLKELGALPAMVGGLSMGGYVTLAYARKYPNDLRAIGLIDTRSEGDNEQGKQNRNRLIQLVREKGSTAIADEMLPKLVAEETLKRRQDITHKLRRIMESQTPKTIENALAAMRDRPDRTPDLPNISVPTLIVVGEQDAITPPSLSEAMSKQLKHSTLSVIRRAGHMSPMEQPQDVTTAFRGFAERVMR